jgi:hypothetical protein
MKHKIKAKAQQLAQNPATIKVLTAMKPEKSVWGFFGIVLFLIVPEIIAFVWGIEITAYAEHELLIVTSAFERQYYEVLLMLFEEGGSWFNLLIGLAFLVWFFF